MKTYGKELILDLHGCDVTKCTREKIGAFFDRLCKVIDMVQVKQVWWENLDSPEEHLNGISAVQFIETSNITIHTLHKLKRVYLNIFSCKDFDVSIVVPFASEWFGGKVVNSLVIGRK